MSGTPIILYTRRFEKQHESLPREIKIKAEKTIELFLENILHPSLRLHKLSGPLMGLWSISIDRNYRIILEPMKDNTYLFHSVGTHAIYKKT